MVTKNIRIPGFGPIGTLGVEVYKKPTVEDLAIGFYRLVKSPNEVNWQARRTYDESFLVQTLYPELLDFTERGIHRATYQNQVKPEGRRLRAVIGFSGGFDSTMTAYVVADSMQRSIEEGRTKEADIYLINFAGLEDCPIDRTTKDIQSRFPKVRTSLVKANLSKINKGTLKMSNYLSDQSELGDEHPEECGQLTTRNICTLINDFAERHNAASIDPTNGTEWILGELTVGTGYMVVPFPDLFKSTLYKLAELNRFPILRAPSRNSAYNALTKPELYFGKLPEGISTWNAFEILDPVLHWLFERKKSTKTISHALNHSRPFIEQTKKRVDNQCPRRDPQVFMIRNRGKFWKGIISKEETEKIEDEMMLGALFR